MKKINTPSLMRSILPSSITKDKKVVDSAEALDSQLKEISAHTDDGMLLYKIDYLPSDVLDHLAMQWDAEVWRDSWPLHIKRSSLKALISEKTRMGTVSAVKNAIKGLGSAGYITEWFAREPPTAPHTFNISIDQNEIEGIADEELIYDIKRSINATKPVRSQYTISVIQKFQDDIFAGGSSRPLVYGRISQTITENADVASNIYAAAASRPLTFARISQYVGVPYGCATDKTVTISASARALTYTRLTPKAKESAKLGVSLTLSDGIRPLSFNRI